MNFDELKIIQIALVMENKYLNNILLASSEAVLQSPSNSLKLITGSW
jgi:hypothetical protein